MLQRREWEGAQDPAQRARHAYDPRDYDLGHDRLLVDGEHDLFGDGRVVCLPTFGHTPGHQSLRVRLATGDVVLAADACYLRRTLEALHLPPIPARPRGDARLAPPPARLARRGRAHPLRARPGAVGRPAPVARRARLV